MTDRVGQFLGNYQLLRRLGRGAFADVYLAEHRYLEVSAAIKILHVRMEPNSHKQFLLEARTIAHLQHPHIVRVLDFGFEDQTPYLVMEYTPNGTLRTRHPKGTRLPLEQIVRYVKQIASALDLPQQTAHEVLDKMCERDGAGLVVGIAGLSQNQHPHRFTVNGIQLSTWCAWDSLFLPVMLQQTALVSSRCPSTGETIRLTITPEGVTSKHPASAAISIVIPQPTTSGLESVEEIWMTFCHHIHFFSSPQAAQEWFAAREQEIAIFTIEEAFELGRLTLSEVLQYI